MSVSCAFILSFWMAERRDSQREMVDGEIVRGSFGLEYALKEYCHVDWRSGNSLRRTKRHGGRSVQVIKSTHQDIGA
jgi:hypothetical protein